MSSLIRGKRKQPLFLGYRWVLWLSLAVLSAPVVIFVIFVNLPLARDLWPPAAGYAVLAVTCLLGFNVVASMLVTSYSDPGIVPPAPPHVAQQGSEPPQIFINGAPYRLRFCSSCNIYRPPRTSHCRIIDCCVERFDHHCPWVGGTIGKGNYRSFLWLLFSIVTLELWVVGWCFAVLAIDSDLNSRSYSEAIHRLPAAIALPAFIALIGWFPLLLLLYHCSLVSQNFTTYERYRLSRIPADERRSFLKNNPFHDGVVYNWLSIVCFPGSFPSAEAAALIEWELKNGTTLDALNGLKPAPAPAAPDSDALETIPEEDPAPRSALGPRHGTQLTETRARMLGSALHPAAPPQLGQYTSDLSALHSYEDIESEEEGEVPQSPIEVAVHRSASTGVSPSTPSRAEQIRALSRSGLIRGISITEGASPHVHTTGSVGLGLGEGGPSSSAYMSSPSTPLVIHEPIVFTPLGSATPPRSAQLGAGPRPSPRPVYVGFVDFSPGPSPGPPIPRSGSRPPSPARQRGNTEEDLQSRVDSRVSSYTCSVGGFYSPQGSVGSVHSRQPSSPSLYQYAQGAQASSGTVSSASLSGMLRSVVRSPPRSSRRSMGAAVWATSTDDQAGRGQLVKYLDLAAGQGTPGPAALGGFGSRTAPTREFGTPMTSRDRGASQPGGGRSHRELEDTAPATVEFSPEERSPSSAREGGTLAIEHQESLVFPPLPPLDEPEDELEGERGGAGKFKGRTL